MLINEKTSVCVSILLSSQHVYFFLMQKDECVGIVNVFFDIEKNYNYESKNQYLHIIK
jgi:coproporphyrinogen III oxidase